MLRPHKTSSIIKQTRRGELHENQPCTGQLHVTLHFYIIHFYCPTRTWWFIQRCEHGGRFIGDGVGCHVSWLEWKLMRGSCGTSQNPLNSSGNGTLANTVGARNKYLSGKRIWYIRKGVRADDMLRRNPPPLFRTGSGTGSGPRTSGWVMGLGARRRRWERTTSN